MYVNTYLPEGARLRTPENHEYVSCRAGLERALERQVILEAPVILCDHDFTLHIALGGGVIGRMEREEVQYAPSGEDIKDIAILTRVGKPVCFKVCGFSRGEGGECIAHLSRKSAQRECMLHYISTLVPGDVIPSRVTHLESFGAFVDIGCGIISLLSIDCISVSRIAHPSVRLSVGDSIYTVVKSMDDRGRLYVSMRELLGTWEENAALFSEGQTVRGTVRSVESYGVFVELTPNLAGLAESREGVCAGQICAVFIKSILPEKMKIKLILIDSYDAPPGISPAPLRYFIPTERVKHMDAWTYSPEACPRLVESTFAVGAL